MQELPQRLYSEIGAGDDCGLPDVKIRNTIIAKNTDNFGNPRCLRARPLVGYNLIGNTAGTEIVADTTGNRLNVDPKLGPQDNGGPTLTRGLPSGSPALDRGDAGVTTKDQRGYKRPVDFADVMNAPSGDGSDIGAFEVQAGTPIRR